MDPVTPAPFEGSQVPAKPPEAPESSLPFGAPEGAPGTPGNLPNYQQQWQRGESGPGLSAKPTKWDKVMGGLKQGAAGSLLLGTIPRKISDSLINTGNMVDPVDANKLNPYRETPYTTPVDAGIVAMEAADAQKKQQLQEWLSRNEIGGAGFGRFMGGLADIPIYAAVGAATGGVGDLFVGGAATMGRIAAGVARYAWTLGEFSAVGELQNKLETSMGAQEKPIHEVVQENLLGAGIATGLGALARRFLRSGEANPEALQQGVKQSAAALATDEKLPSMVEQRAVLENRRAGVTLDPSGEHILPTVKTAPLSQTPMYAATHGDGTPLVHEPGLGRGVQFTDSFEKANHGVSRSMDVPGQIGETKLPEGTSLLDMSRSAAEDYASKDGLLKAIEEKTGIPLDAAVKSGESIKDVIANLGDWAGADLGGGKIIPEDILAQVQSIAEAQGYKGYLMGSDGARVAHVFDPAGLELANVTHADPSQTPGLPGAQAAQQMPNTEAAVENTDREKSQNYSPAIQEALDKIRKTSETLHPDDLDSQISEAEKTLAEHKQQLSALAEGNAEAKAAIEKLREQEAHDKRMLDLAKRIMDCGATE